MRKLRGLLTLLLSTTMLFSACSSNENNHSNNDPAKLNASPFPENCFVDTEKQSVIGSIVQTGDGTAYVTGNIGTSKGKNKARLSSPQRRSATPTEDSIDANKQLVTLEHNFQGLCYVSGYIGNSLYIIQDFGNLSWNKKGIGHKDGTVLLEYGVNGYFSVSAFSENKVIVGNPTDPSIESLMSPTDSYMFGYMVYNPDTKQLTPMYEDNNLRFYTAGYFMNGVAMVSVKENDQILFGIIDENGDYIVEPQYELMADESIDDVVIVGKQAEPAFPDEYNFDTCGRHINYNSTLMTLVQMARHYEAKSNSMGLINTLTGENVLPCEYIYIERVMDHTYFVIDQEGAKSLYNMDTNTFTPVNEGVYSYFNSEWMLYTNNLGEAYLADRELTLYETTGLTLEPEKIRDIYYFAENAVNQNVISAVRDEQAQKAYQSIENDAIQTKVDFGTLRTTITVTATGEVLPNLTSYTKPYNNSFFYTLENSLYRYDLTTNTNKLVETGYGNYTEDYTNSGQKYSTNIYPLDDGVFELRYHVIQGYGASYLIILINDQGEVLFDTSINSVDTLEKNYLGKYDDALYELAGNTNIDDNYFLTRDDGEHFLIQFVRGNSENSNLGESIDFRYTRRIDSTNTISLLSPFVLDFVNGDEITITIDGKAVSPDNYVYNPETQSLKFLSKMFFDDLSYFHTLRQNNGVLEIFVSAGDESQRLTIEVSPFAYRFFDNLFPFA